MTRKWLQTAVGASLLLIASTSAFAQGTVTGKIKLTAVPPPNARIPMGADPNCLTINAGKRVVQERVLRAADGGLANVFVNVKGSFPQAAGGAPAIIDQRGCTYHPRIQGVRVGQSISIKNSDATLHNVHSLSKKGNDFNSGQPQAGMVFKYQLKSEEVMLHIKCDVHPWMTGYVGVVNHPYYATSDATGSFKITGVPAGKQTIQVWHEKYGFLTQTVDVKAGGTTNVDFTYSGDEKPAAADNRIQELVIPAEAADVELIAPTR
jgi:plastocyanin